MKKNNFLFVILCLILVLTSCNVSADKTHTGDSNIHAENKEYEKGPDFAASMILPSYSSVEEFVKSDFFSILISNRVYMDLNSILPSEEVEEITAGLEYAGWDTDPNITQYAISYKSDNEEKQGLHIIIGYGKDFYKDHFFSPEKESILAKGKTYNALKNVPEGNSESFVCNIDEICMLYSYHNGKIDTIRFMIDEHYFNIYAFRSASPAQDEFISAFLPELGATDDTLIAMLNRIKALIPTGDETNGVQANASADSSFEFVSTDPIDTPSSNDSGNSEQTAGETVEDTDVSDTNVSEEEEYLYPEDYEFPVIPGISPDWKPNRNGKYPLKDGYTREELTLILACEIELDFGDLTDEEISKLEFRLIEEEENEE